MLVAYLHFAAKPSDSAPAPIETWSLRAVKFLAKTSRLLMHVKVPVVIQGRGCLLVLPVRLFILPVAAATGEAATASSAATAAGKAAASSASSTAAAGRVGCGIAPYKSVILLRDAVQIRRKDDPARKGFFFCIIRFLLFTGL